MERNARGSFRSGRSRDVMAGVIEERMGTLRGSVRAFVTCLIVTFWP